MIADSTVFWWNKPAQPSLWESKIELGEKFYNEIVNHPVPIEMNTLTALKRSTLGLDLYLWLVYRTFTLRAPLRLTWRLLYCQFGAHPDKAERQQHRSTLPVQGAPGVEENQDGLVRPKLLDGERPPDLASLDTGHRSVIRPTAPRGIDPRVLPQEGRDEIEDIHLGLPKSD